MTDFTMEKVRQIIDEAEAHRDGDGDEIGRFTDTNAYDFLRCARFLLGFIDQGAKAEAWRTVAEKGWRDRNAPSK